GNSGWLNWAAFASAVLAVLGAVGALKSGHYANEAMMSQIKASDEWAYFQAKGLKSSMLETRKQILEAIGKPLDVSEKLKEYATEQQELKKAAEEREHESQLRFHTHEQFAQSVTMFQIAIAVTAVAALAGRRRFLFAALAFGCVGCFF